MLKSNLSDGFMNVSTNLYIIPELVLPFYDVLHKFLDLLVWYFTPF